MRRPDLAATVRQLDIAIISGIIGHLGRCWIYKDWDEDYCRCKLDDTSELCENLLLTAEFRSKLDFYYLRRMAYVRAGSRLAVLRVVLSCTHNSRRWQKNDIGFLGLNGNCL
jgi:hypothetical protein